MHQFCLLHVAQRSPEVFRKMMSGSSGCWSFEEHPLMSLDVQVSSSQLAPCLGQVLIRVQVYLNRWTVKHNSRFSQSFLEVFCSQTGFWLVLSDVLLEEPWMLIVGTDERILEWRSDTLVKVIRELRFPGAPTHFQGSTFNFTIKLYKAKILHASCLSWCLLVLISSYHCWTVWASFSVNMNEL